MHLLQIITLPRREKYVYDTYKVYKIYSNYILLYTYGKPYSLIVYGLAQTLIM